MATHTNERSTPNKIAGVPCNNDSFPTAASTFHIRYHLSKLYIQTLAIPSIILKFKLFVPEFKSVNWFKTQELRGLNLKVWCSG